MLLLSCTVESSASYVSDFKVFVASVEENCQSYSQEDWVKADVQYSRFTEAEYEKYKEYLIPSQSKEVNRLIGKYKAVKLKATVITAGSEINNLLEQATGFVEEFFKDSSTLFNQ